MSDKVDVGDEYIVKPAERTRKLMDIWWKVNRSNSVRFVFRELQSYGPKPYCRSHRKYHDC